jgi:serine/threonine protein kinase
MTAGLVSQAATRNNALQPFGKYFLQERIGAGGMAEVFRAIAVGPEGFQRTLVIKRILPHLSQDASFVRMFINEAKISGLLSHPNLVQIFEFGKVEDSYFIAMEHVHGRTLLSLQLRLVEMGRPPVVAATAEIGRQICAGLHCAHALESDDGQRLGIIHRDISPSNLMLAFHGGVKILDFGIARVASGLRQANTQLGSLKGKVSYMSPEQIQLDEIDQRSDIFSVGIVLHEMLTGRRLFRGNSELTASRKVLELAIPPPSQLNAEVPPELDRVVMRALERDRDARYATAGDMANDLDRLMQDLRMSPRDHVHLMNASFPHQTAPVAAMAGMFAPPTAPGEMTSLSPPAGVAGQRRVDESAARVVALGHDPHTTRTRSPGDGQWPEVSLSWAALGDGASQPRPGTPVRNPFYRRRTALIAAPLLAIAGFLLWSWPHGKGAQPLSSTRTAAGPATRATQTVAAMSALVHCSLDSAPQDAVVIRVDSARTVGRTPLNVALPRSDQVIFFRFEKAGYEPALYKVIPDLDKVVHVVLRSLSPPRPVAAATSDRGRARISDPASGLRKAGPRRPAQGTKLSRGAAKSFRDATPIDPFTM